MDRKPKILLFDIEASNLAANFGFVYCIGYKWLDSKKVTILSIRNHKKFLEDPTADGDVIEEFRPVLREADIVVHHYGSKFDVPFLQTRCFENEAQPLPEVACVDTWRIARFRMKFNSNRLDTIAKSAQLKVQKTPINNKAWVRAASGHLPSIKEIEHHCKMDVLVLEEVYKKLRPFANNHPTLSVLQGYNGCPSCTSRNCIKQGIRAAGTTLKQQYNCKDCGRWFLTTTSKIVG